MEPAWILAWPLNTDPVADPSQSASSVHAAVPVDPCVTLISFSHDKTIRVWNIKTNSPWSVMTLTGHSGEVRCLHLEGNRVVSIDH